jgi:hypothetical protein
MLRGPLFHLEDKNEETRKKDNDHSGNLATAYAFDSANNGSQAGEEESFQTRRSAAECKPGKLTHQIQFASADAELTNSCVSEGG